jgi:hypothetical protein
MLEGLESHPLPPGSQTLIVPLPRREGVDARVPFLLFVFDWRVDLHPIRVQDLDVVLVGEAAVAQHLLGLGAVTLLELLDHRCQLHPRDS